MKTATKFLTLLCTVMAVTGCNRLSEEARQMTGVYYQTAVSENEPVMELNDNGSCTVHAIKPGVMSYTVNGTWNVENDSLLIETEGVAASVTGDTTVIRIGRIPTRISYAIADFNGLSLTLRRDGNDYVYVRRGHNEELEKASKTAE